MIYTISSELPWGLGPSARTMNGVGWNCFLEYSYGTTSPTSYATKKEARPLAVFFVFVFQWAVPAGWKQTVRAFLSSECVVPVIIHSDCGSPRAAISSRLYSYFARMVIQKFTSSSTVCKRTCVYFFAIHGQSLRLAPSEIWIVLRYGQTYTKIKSKR